MIKLIQFSRDFQVDPTSKHYFRIFVETDDIGAISIIYDPASDKPICRSYFPYQVNSNVRWGVDNCGSLVIDTQEGSFENRKALDIFYSPEEMRIFKFITLFFQRAFENHRDKLYAAHYAENTYLGESLKHIRLALAVLNNMIREEKGVLEKATEVVEKIKEKVFRRMFYCDDAGLYANITSGMIYEIVEQGVKGKYVKIKDDFGKERLFNSNRFTVVEVEVEENQG